MSVCSWMIVLSHSNTPYVIFLQVETEREPTRVVWINTITCSILLAENHPLILKHSSLTHTHLSCWGTYTHMNMIKQGSEVRRKPEVPSSRRVRAGDGREANVQTWNTCFGYQMELWVSLDQLSVSRQQLSVERKILERAVRPGMCASVWVKSVVMVRYSEAPHSLGQTRFLSVAPIAWLSPELMKSEETGIIEGWKWSIRGQKAAEL